MAEAIAAFRRSGSLPRSKEEWSTARRLFAAARIDDEGTETEIARVWHEAGVLVDPHSAVAVAAARVARRDPSVPMVALACAHPAKFPDAVESATGRRPALPPHLGDLMTRPERVTMLPNDLRAVEDYVRAKVSMATAGGSA